LVKEGSERAEFRCVDTIRINKLGANDSGFRNFVHDVNQKSPLFWRARQESNLRRFGDLNRQKTYKYFK